MHRSDNVFHAESQTLGLYYELFQFLFEEAAALSCSGGAGGDDGARAWAHFQQALGNQMTDYFVRGIGINLERSAEHPDRRKSITGTKLSRDDRLFGRIGRLFVERSSGLKH